MESVNKIIESCHTCLRYRTPHQKPIISMPTAYAFSESVYLDSKVLDGVYLLVFVDLYTRFSGETIVANKKTVSIINVLVAG